MWADSGQMCTDLGGDVADRAQVGGRDLDFEEVVILLVYVVMAYIVIAYLDFEEVVILRLCCDVDAVQLKSVFLACAVPACERV